MKLPRMIGTRDPHGAGPVTVRASCPGLAGPRRARRGVGTLTAVMLVAGIAAVALASWQMATAAERLRGHARHLAETVSAEGFGLHHWLHAERIAGTLAAPPEGQARQLTNAERGRLASHAAVARWRRSAADATRPVLPRGWEIVHLIGTAGGLPDGVLVLRPSNELVTLPTWDATRQALDVTFGTAEDGAAALATIALAVSPLDAYDAARDRAVPASRFARLDTDAVLRELHAGHARLAMRTAIEMDRNDLAGVALLSGQRGRIPRIDGTCTGTTLCAGSLDLGDVLLANNGATLDTATADDVTITGNVTGITRMRTGDTTVAGTVTTPVLTSCADAEADLCGGGDLDLETGSGTPNWTTAAIFGDTVIRNGNRLTGVSAVTARTGIFGTLTGALTLRGCLRSVNPFIHGAGC